jgi:chorismate mutase
VTREDAGLTPYRERISELDRSILAAVNERLGIVAELKRYKDEHGIAFLDPDREARMLAELRRENGGPLSEAGVAELLQAILDLTKREVERATAT